MPRALPPLLLLLAVARAADVFVIADTANQTRAIADAVNETVAEANVLLVDNATLDHEPVVRKKRTFGDIVFRGLADVLGYKVARKPPQVVFPPPLAPVPGIDAPLRVNLPQSTQLHAIPFAVLPVIAAAPAQPQAVSTPTCGQAAAAPCKAQAQKPALSPCAQAKALAKPRPKPKATAPCGSQATSSPCDPAPPAATAQKEDSNLERISSNFRLDFNFNRAPAVSAASETTVEQPQQGQPKQEQIKPIAIQPQAAKLPPEPPRNPHVYLDAFVVQNGVTQKIRTVDALHLGKHQADNDFLVYDDLEEPQQEQPLREQPQRQQPQQEQHQQEPAHQQDDDYDYVEETSDAIKSMREFGSAIDMFWDQKKNKKRKLPKYDYRLVHFGDRNLANQFRDEEMHQSLQMNDQMPTMKRQTFPRPDEEEEETTTPTQDPRRRLKPRILPPTEKNPNQIDTVTVRVPPIYKEKHPKKLHRDRTERPDHDESDDRPYEYMYHRPDRGQERHGSDYTLDRHHGSDHGSQRLHDSDNGPEHHHSSNNGPRLDRHHGSDHGSQRLHDSDHGPEHHHSSNIGPDGHHDSEHSPERHHSSDLRSERHHDSDHEAESHHSSDTESQNSEPTYQTEKPKRKRKRKNKRKTRSIYSQHYTAGDFDYYGKKLPISKEEEYFRGLTIPPPTKDVDLARLELGQDGEGHFLDDHERLGEDAERIKTKRKDGGKKKSEESERIEEPEQSDDSEGSNESERVTKSEGSEKSERSEDTERSGENEHADESERSDRLSPNARVRESGYKTNFVRAHNVQVDDAQPFVRTVKRKKPKVTNKA